MKGAREERKIKEKKGERKERRVTASTNGRKLMESEETERKGGDEKG